MAKSNSKSLAAAVGAAFLTTASLAPFASAAENPFQMTELGSGYQVADSHEGKCGEGKCGGEKGEKHKSKSEGEGKCGEKKDKADAEGKCGEHKARAEDKGGEDKSGE